MQKKLTAKRAIEYKLAVSHFHPSVAGMCLSSKKIAMAPYDAFIPELTTYYITRYICIKPKS